MSVLLRTGVGAWRSLWRAGCRAMRCGGPDKAHKSSASVRRRCVSMREFKL